MRTLLLALALGALSPAATGQYYDEHQRTAIVVKLPSRPAKSSFSNRLVYRAAMKKYHSEVRRMLRAERREFRRLYNLRRRPVIIHRPNS